MTDHWILELDATYREQERIYVRKDDYSTDHNVRASRVAEAVRLALKHPAGDSIDVGLAVTIELEKQGFKLIQVPK